LFSAKAFLACLFDFAPEMLAAAQAAMAGAVVDGQRISPNADAFAASPSDSIDYAVMEKAARVAVVPVSMGWSDVGSWDALVEIAGGNLAQGPNMLTLDCDGCYIASNGLRISAVGVQDLIIIASGNELLIVPRGQSQDVKKIVEARKSMPGEGV
jgi:mannose-1-phosphate guanylyltransferase/mannose-1-phosphate guanylyltransferase/mannose-6-phosphate isomerase